MRLLHQFVAFCANRVSRVDLAATTETRLLPWTNQEPNPNLANQEPSRTFSVERNFRISRSNLPDTRYQHMDFLIECLLFFRCGQASLQVCSSVFFFFCCKCVLLLLLLLLTGGEAQLGIPKAEQQVGAKHGRGHDPAHGHAWGACYLAHWVDFLTAWLIPMAL